MKVNSINKKAFTLIELLIVIITLGILVLLSAPKVLENVKDAKLTQIKNDVKIAEGLMSEYFVSHGEFPDKWKNISLVELRELASSSKLYDISGHVKEISDGEYKEIDKKYLIREIRTNLGGKFYVNNANKVYYEDDKSSEMKKKDELFDREIDKNETEQNKMKVLSYTFPNGIYKNDETVTGDIKIEGLESGDFVIETLYSHSKFNSSLDDSVKFNLKEGQIKTIDFDLLVKPEYLRGFYDFEIFVKDENDNILESYKVIQTIYFAEDEWIYYYEDDFNKVDKLIAGEIGRISPDRVSFDYVHEEINGKTIDYSSVNFDVHENESGQIESILPETYGTYEAMIKVPDNDALLNGFFLYGHNENNNNIEHEIDIEILYYEGRWQVWGTVFNETHKDYIYNGIEPGVIYQKAIDLNFDPSEDHHSYRIDFYDDFISFAVDGIEFGRWENEFDYGDMYLHAGNFYTHWLTGEFSEKPLDMNVKWMRKGYFK